ncbi:MAG: chromosomal replication initiator DnaA [Rhizobiaceae bacterium]|nr:chromosomal replication initiator DnaA [Rhizobiaceae bacterium]
MKSFAIKDSRFQPGERFERDPFLNDIGRQRLQRSQERAIEICGNVVEIISALFNVPSKELKASHRTSHSIAQVRQIAMYVAHVVMRLTMKEVGLGFDRDRTTVLYACHQVEDMRDDIEFDQMVARAERITAAALGDKVEG